VSDLEHTNRSDLRSYNIYITIWLPSFWGRFLLETSPLMLLFRASKAPGAPGELGSRRNFDLRCFTTTLYLDSRHVQLLLIRGQVMNYNFFKAELPDPCRQIPQIMTT